MGKRVAWTMVAAALALAGFCSFATARVGVPGLVRVGNTMIACHHQGSDRFTAEIRPARCDLAGQEGERRKSVSFPIQKLRWSEWGEFRSEGSYGVDTDNGVRVRLIAFRRVRCPDGRVFYSAVNVVEPGNGSYAVVRLPTCDVPR
jgi:hypothetical protein